MLQNNKLILLFNSIKIVFILITNLFKIVILLTIFFDVFY